MKKTLFLFFIFTGIYNRHAFCQSDKTISKNNIPTNICSYIDKKYPDHSSVSYYREIGNDSVYYEASFKYQKENFSLGFDSTGACVETEKEIAFEALSEKIKQTIEQRLKQDFKKYKIKKTEEVQTPELFFYELEVKGKKEHIEYCEYYFNEQGAFLSFEKIHLKNIPSLF